MIYVCIPAHNEARTLGLLLWETRKVLGAFEREYRIVVHDDASTDDTPAVLDRYGKVIPLTALRSGERLGYARSMERLFRHVEEEAPYPKRDCAVVLQADFTEDPENIVELVKIFEGGSDLVAGHVDPDRARWPRGVKLARWAARAALGSALKGAPVSDPLNGLRAYRIIVLKKAFRELEPGEWLLQSDGWAANLELLAKLAPHARRISDVDLTPPRYHMQQRPSRFRPLKTLLSLFRLRGGSWWSDLDAEVV